MKILDVVCAVLLVIGGLAWGVYGIFEFNFVEYLFKGPEDFHMHHKVPAFARVIYVIVGAAAVYQIFQRKQIAERWK